MRKAQRLRYLACDVNCDGHLETSAFALQARNQPPQVEAAHDLHDNEGALFAPAQIEHLADVGVRQLKYQPRLCCDSLDGLLIELAAGEEPFDRHAALAGLRHHGAEMHFAHAACTQRSVEAILG